MEKLLLVEDDSALVRRLTEYLSAEGFRPLSAAGQTQAVAAIDTERPDLALVDITLADLPSVLMPGGKAFPSSFSRLPVMN